MLGKLLLGEPAILAQHFKIRGCAAPGRPGLIGPLWHVIHDGELYDTS